MSYILSSSRDSNEYSTELFDKYLDCIASLKGYFPSCAYAIAADPEWYKFHDHCVHDARLITLLIKQKRMEGYKNKYCNSISFAVLCLNGKVKNIVYDDVFRYSLIKGDGEYNGVWRFDEFSLYAPGIFMHVIEWTDGSKWEICAKEMTVEDKPW